jgi:hypothetical protein
MIEMLTNLTLNIMDFLLGWMLYFPKDAALVVVALGTSAALTFVRLWTTDQDLLARCKADKGRLKALRKQAKRAGDKPALTRIRATESMIAMKQMKSEGKPLLWAIVPVAMLAVWAFSRLGYEAPKPGEPVTLRVYYPAAAIGGIAHVVPQEGLDAGNGWIQRIVEDPKAAPGGKVNGLAAWKLKAAKRDVPYTVEIRHAGQTHRAELLVDGRRYSPPVQAPGDGVLAVELTLVPYKPFGVVPAISWIAFDPWLVGYLLLTVPFVFGLRAVFRIH